MSRLSKSVRLTIVSCFVVAIGIGWWEWRLSHGPKGPNIVLLTIDTLRADRVGHGLTPNLDTLGAGGAIVEGAVAPIARTTQSVATIITGLHPFRHGADGLTMALPTTVTTLAERLQAAGYQTAAFVSNANLAPGLNFEQGFDSFDNPRRRWNGNSATAMTAAVTEWLDRWRARRPLFLWVHYLDPHWSYEPPAEFARRVDPEWNEPLDVFEKTSADEAFRSRMLFEADQVIPPRTLAHVIKLYDGEVAATDATVGDLLKAFKAHGLLDAGTILAFASDHGEALGDHRYWFGHGEYAYDQTLRVPLVFHAPGKIPPGTHVTGWTPLQDITPTLLGLAGLPVPPQEVDGLDLTALLTKGGTIAAPAMSLLHASDHMNIHSSNPRHHVEGREGRWLSIRDGDWKLIRIPLANGQFEEELYRITDDPLELNNLITQAPQELPRLRALLQEHVQRYAAYQPELQQTAPAAPSGVIDSDREKALRALGYLN